MRFILGFLAIIPLSAQQIREFRTAPDASEKAILNQWSSNGNNPLFSLRAVSVSAGKQHSKIWNVQYRSVDLDGIMLSKVCAGNTCFVAGNVLPFEQFETLGLPAEGKMRWIADTTARIWRLYAISNENGLEKRIHVQTGKATLVNRRIYKGNDSFAPGYVFAPDPLSTANVLYGKPHRDRQDSSYAFLDSQRIWVNIPARFANDTFYPGTDRIILGHVSNPLTPKTASASGFNYRRNESGFEDAMAVYHLHRCYTWWDSLGYGMHADTVLADAHAFNGADESAYNPVPNPPTIEWGTGGVDDAEDADAIVHEYTHAAIQGLIPGSYQGTQRQGVEEGICDFMAVAYSALWTSNQPSLVYNWDGHNEFWSGRNLRNNRVYPGSLTNQPHVDGQLFGAALFDLMNEIGRDSAVSLVLGAMPFLLPNISMPVAANMFLKTDSILYKGKYRWPLIKAFYPRGLMPALNSATPANRPAFVIQNSIAFSAGGDATVHSLESGNMQVFDIQGRLVMQIPVTAGNAALLSGADFKPSLYTLRLNNFSVLITKL